MGQLSRLVLLITCFALAVIFSGCDTHQDQLSDNIMLSMKDGKADSIVSKIYAEDISDAVTITFSKTIAIEYFDYDLNSDGIIDKIVTIRSPLHSGSGGDTVDFLIGNSDGTYRRISALVLRLYDVGGDIEDNENASIYILESKTNGFYDILIKNAGSVLGNREILLIYDNDRYKPYEPK